MGRHRRRLARPDGGGERRGLTRRSASRAPESWRIGETDRGVRQLRRTGRCGRSAKRAGPRSQAGRISETPREHVGRRPEAPPRGDRVGGTRGTPPPPSVGRDPGVPGTRPEGNAAEDTWPRRRRPPQGLCAKTAARDEEESGHPPGSGFGDIDGKEGPRAGFPKTVRPPVGGPSGKCPAVIRGCGVPGTQKARRPGPMCRSRTPRQPCAPRGELGRRCDRRA